MLRLKRGASRGRNGLYVLGACCVAAAAVFGIREWYAERPRQGAADNVSQIQRPRPAEEIACPKASAAKPPVVILVLGQSNAGNHGSRRESSTQGVLWYDGRCYPMADPLAGATGSEGSVWSRLAASAWPQSGPGEVVFSVLAVDASSVGDWTRDGPLSNRLRQRVGALRDDHVGVSAVLWQQGEADARADVRRDDYAAALGTLIHRLREGGIVAPVFLARSTRCRNAGSDEIRAGLSLVAAREANVFLGPDTDAFGDDLRRDGCHFNEAGLHMVAEAWGRVLREHALAPPKLPHS